MKMETANANAIGPFTKFLIKIASADENTLRVSPPHDLAHVKATAELLLLTMIYQAAIFGLVSHSLFAAPGQIRPDLIVVGVFLSVFIMMIDSFCVVGSAWGLSGIEEIRRGGLDVSGGPGPRIKAAIYLGFRILLSIGLSALTAIFVSILVFQADIQAYVDQTYRQANFHLLAPATAGVDAAIRRATDEVEAQARVVASLSAQVGTLRQGEIDPYANDPRVQQAQAELTQLMQDKTAADGAVGTAESFAAQELAGASGKGHTGLAGSGPRRKAALEEIANARGRAQRADVALAGARDRLDAARKEASQTTGDNAKPAASDKLPAFESSLKAETEKLAAVKDELRRLTAGREDAIREAIERSPDHVGLDGGFLARILALEHIAQSDPKIGTVIILIDVASFGLELAAVLAKVTSFQPTTYSALIARDAYLRALHIADEINREIDISTRAFSAEAGRLNPRPASPFDLTPDSADNLSVPSPGPPKRPRGRPRKCPPPDDQ